MAETVTKSSDLAQSTTQVHQPNPYPPGYHQPEELLNSSRNGPNKASQPNADVGDIAPKKLIF